MNKKLDKSAMRRQMAEKPTAVESKPFLREELSAILQEELSKVTPGDVLTLTERSDNEDSEHESWANVKLPDPATRLLARADRAINGARTISDLLIRNRLLEEDAEDQNLIYAPLSSRDARGLERAFVFLMDEAECAVEDIRLHFLKERG